MDHKLGGIPVNAGEIELSLLKKRNEYQNLKKDLSWGGVWWLNLLLISKWSVERDFSAVNICSFKPEGVENEKVRRRKSWQICID